MSSIISPIQEMLVFQTDFGYKDSSVAAMYGVVKSVLKSLTAPMNCLSLISGVHPTACGRQCVSGQREPSSWL